MKKCKKCHCPLEGFMAKICCFFGCKPSEKDSELCCKCETKQEDQPKSDLASDKQEVKKEEDR